MDTIIAVAGNNLTAKRFEIKMFSFRPQTYPRHFFRFFFFFFFENYFRFLDVFHQWLDEFAFEPFCKLGLTDELDPNLQYIFRDLNTSTQPEITHSKPTIETLKQHVIPVQS